LSTQKVVTQKVVKLAQCFSQISGSENPIVTIKLQVDTKST